MSKNVDMKRSALLLALIVMPMLAYSQSCRLQKHGDAFQLVVDGRRFIVLGGELGNSSAACDADIEKNFAKLRRMSLNTVLVPAY